MALRSRPGVFLFLSPSLRCNTREEEEEEEEEAIQGASEEESEKKARKKKSPRVSYKNIFRH
jgi:hypothetical protein